MKSRFFSVSSDRRFKENRSPVADCGPVERWQHTGRLFEMTDRAGVLASRAMEENILDYLYFQNRISVSQHKAALRLKADYVAADMEAHLASSYNPSRVSTTYYAGCDDRTDEQEAAYQRWRAAIVAVGELFSDAVITLACHDIAPDENHELPLQIGLFRLAKWYRDGVG